MDFIHSFSLDRSCLYFSKSLSSSSSVFLVLFPFHFRPSNLPYFLILNAAGDSDDANVKSDARSNSISMNSVGKVLYESVQRESDVTRNNLVYCPSPYATTRVSLFFPPSNGNNSSELATTGVHGGNGLTITGHASSRGDLTAALMPEQNCYDMPLIKQVNYGISLESFVMRRMK